MLSIKIYQFQSKKRKGGSAPRALEGARDARSAGCCSTSLLLTPPPQWDKKARIKQFYSDPVSATRRWSCNIRQQLVLSKLHLLPNYSVTEYVCGFFFFFPIQNENKLEKMAEKDTSMSEVRCKSMCHCDALSREGNEKYNGFASA